jgi:hypothetical protein
MNISEIAAFGISDMNGINNIDNKNNTPAIKEVSPVLPPDAIPVVPCLWVLMQ